AATAPSESRSTSRSCRRLPGKPPHPSPEPLDNRHAGGLTPFPQRCGRLVRLLSNRAADRRGKGVCPLAALQAPFSSLSRLTTGSPALRLSHDTTQDRVATIE